MAIFAWVLYSLGLLSYSPVVYHLVRGGVLLHDEVRVNCKKGASPDNKARCLVYYMR